MESETRICKACLRILHLRCALLRMLIFPLLAAMHAKVPIDTHARKRATRIAHWVFIVSNSHCVVV